MEHEVFNTYDEVWERLAKLNNKIGMPFGDISIVPVCDKQIWELWYEPLPHWFHDYIKKERAKK